MNIFLLLFVFILRGLRACCKTQQFTDQKLCAIQWVARPSSTPIFWGHVEVCAFLHRFTVKYILNIKEILQHIKFVGSETIFVHKSWLYYSQLYRCRRALWRQTTSIAWILKQLNDSLEKEKEKGKLWRFERFSFGEETEKGTSINFKDFHLKRKKKKALV